MTRSELPRLALIAALSALALGCATQEESQETTDAFSVPVEYHTLDNGLKVVLSPDTTSPIVTVAVYYNIGFRIEPKERTGFAHLFEHMMFQGSANLGKMEFIQLVQQNGGILNGSTRYDFTNYFEIVPSHKLETMLWAEADRLRGLAITEENLKNQRDVVKNEVRVNVLNQPYGGFPWLDVPQVAFTNWYNSHNFYGEMADLDAASLSDVERFFKSYYAPNNAALVVVGDFESKQALTWIREYFADIPRAETAALPDISEPPQKEERHGSRVAPQANRPALAFAYRMPDRGSPEYFALGVLDQILLQGDDSLLHQALVQRNGFTDQVEGGINWPLGHMFNYNGPTLWMASLYHDSSVKGDQIMREVDGAIGTLQSTPVDQAALDRALAKWRSSFYDAVGSDFGFGRADLLACFALFDDDPAQINTLDQRLREVTPELVQTVAKRYLRAADRTIYTIEPGAEKGQGGAQ
ncbi:MAG: insulinase family protein [Luteitalea sp.]|nr:insulinase family protein [Luteitalea sp.]